MRTPQEAGFLVSRLWRETAPPPSTLWSPVWTPRLLSSPLQKNKLFTFRGSSGKTPRFQPKSASPKIRCPAVKARSLYSPPHPRWRSSPARAGASAGSGHGLRLRGSIRGSDSKNPRAEKTKSAARSAPRNAVGVQERTPTSSQQACFFWSSGNEIGGFLRVSILGPQNWFFARANEELVGVLHWRVRGCALEGS